MKCVLITAECTQWAAVLTAAQKAGVKVFFGDILQLESIEDLQILSNSFDLIRVSVEDLLRLRDRFQLNLPLRGVLSQIFNSPRIMALYRKNLASQTVDWYFRTSLTRKYNFHDLLVKFFAIRRMNELISEMSPDLLIQDELLGTLEVREKISSFLKCPTLELKLSNLGSHFYTSKFLSDLRDLNNVGF